MPNSYEMGSAGIIEGAILVTIVAWVASDPGDGAKTWPLIVGGFGFVLFVMGILMLFTAGGGEGAVLVMLIPGGLASILLLLAGYWFARGGGNGLALASRIGVALPVLYVVVTLVRGMLAGKRSDGAKE